MYAYKPVERSTFLALDQLCRLFLVSQNIVIIWVN